MTLIARNDKRPGRPRTFREELLLWQAWRDGSQSFRKLSGWDHNSWLFGMVYFAHQQGWIADSILYILLVFEIEVVVLVPIGLLSFPPYPLLIDFIAMVITLGYLCVRLWFSSKLVFSVFAAVLVGVIGLAAVLGQLAFF